MVKSILVSIVTILLIIAHFASLNIAYSNSSESDSSTTKTVIINELMPDPDFGRDTDFEWIELYNITDSEINLYGWKIDDKTITENIAIQPHSYLIAVRNKIKFLQEYVPAKSDLEYVNEQNTIQLNFSLANTNSSVTLQSDDEQYIDTIAYISTKPETSLERQGPYCSELVLHADSNTLGYENFNLNEECFNNSQITINSILFGNNDKEFLETNIFEPDEEIYMNYILSDNAEIINEELFLEDGTVVTNPIILQKYQGRVRLKLTLINNEVIQKWSKSITVTSKNIDDPIEEYKVLITEVYPSPQTSKGEKEWVEIYNHGLENTNLTGWFFSKETEGTKCKNNVNQFFNNKTIKSKQHFITEHPNIKITLANNGGKIFLCNNNSDVVSSVEYPKTTYGNSYSRIYKNEYLKKWQVSTNPTPKKYNLSPKTENPIYKIANAKNLKNKTIVTIQGFVTVDSNILAQRTFYIQDDTAGIKVYLYAGINNEFSLGDYLQITGELSESAKEKKLNVKAIENIKVLKNKKITEPISINKISDDIVGNLVYIQGYIAKNYSKSFDVQVNGGLIRVSVLNPTGIDLPVKSKGDYVKIIGIVSVNGNSLRVLPRYQSDVVINQILSAKTKKASQVTKSAKINLTHSADVTEYQTPAPSALKINENNYENSNITYQNNGYKIFFVGSIFSIALLCYTLIKNKDELLNEVNNLKIKRQNNNITKEKYF